MKKSEKYGVNDGWIFMNVGTIIGLMKYKRFVSAKKLYLPVHCGVGGRELRPVSCVTLVESPRFALPQNGTFGMFSGC